MMDALANATEVITLQYISVSSQHIVYLKRIEGQLYLKDAGKNCGGSSLQSSQNDRTHTLVTPRHT